MNDPGRLRPAPLAAAAVAALALGACGDGDPPAAAPTASPGGLSGAAAAAAPGDPPSAATPAHLSRAAEQARAAVGAYVAAVNALDIDSAASFYSDSPDFRWIEDGAVRYRSAEESRASMAALAQMASSTELTLSDLSVAAPAPDVAVATCGFAQAVHVDGRPGFAFSGALTIVLRREGGRWLFVSGHTSSAPGGRP